METYNKLFKFLEDGDLILTPNKRLIDFLLKSYAYYQQAHKKKVWSTPNIIQLETWIILQWEKQLIQKSYNLSHRLLSKNQEYILWQSIIIKSAANFLMPEKIAKTAQQAWQLNHLWQLNYTSSQFGQSNESHAWKIWAENFVAFSQKHNCIDFARATTQLIELFRKKKLTPPQRILLIGFDEIPPQIKKLFLSLEQAGSQIFTFAVSVPQPIAKRLALKDTETELKSMARWAYQSWQAGKKNIVCAVPNLLEIRTQVVTCFTETFTDLHPYQLDPLPFNIAAGKKLNEFPIIQIALTLLQLKLINPFSKISLLIRSPYLAHAQQEESQRAQLDIYCRRYLENTVSLEQLATISLEQHCPQLSQLLRGLIIILNSQKFNFQQVPRNVDACNHICKNSAAKNSFAQAQQYPSQWASYFAQKLQAMAWPGQRPLLTDEFQLVERWSELLNEFRSLDFILAEISEEIALQHLQQLAAESLFQAKTIHNPPIHVLGLLDTAGLCAENLWIMGLDDKSWPTTAHPNPFIPYALQRNHQLPHSSNEREAYFSSLVIKRLLKSACTIVVSHPEQVHEQILRPSSLITILPSIELKELALHDYSNRIESIWASRSWEYYVDDTAPRLKAHETVSKGSQLFKSQAACPFQAFAQFRLQTRFDPLPQAGLKHSERGILLHYVIEILWNYLGDQATLLNQSPQTLQVLINRAITLAIEKFSKKRPFTFKPKFIQIEHQRLQHHLSKLLALDKKRPPFLKVVHEEKQNFSFANLSLNLRIDRIDQLADGSKLLIDYKTGVPTKINWFEERLDEPQLPLYCLSHSSVKGFAIIYIRSNTLEAHGYSETENGISQVIANKKDKNLPQTMIELFNFWKSALEKLAYQFQIGVANVDPKKGSNTCRLCNLQLFCRINHQKVEAKTIQNELK